MSYRNTAAGTKNAGTFNLYAYGFPIDSSKTAQSITLPDNPNVVVLAGTVTSDGFSGSVGKGTQTYREGHGFKKGVGILLPHDEMP